MAYRPGARAQPRPPAGVNTPFIPGLGFYMPEWTLQGDQQFHLRDPR